MPNPYSDLPTTSYWRRSVSKEARHSLDPALDAPFKLSKLDKVATAGSCFAQHISKALTKNDFTYLVTEQGPSERQFGVFPAHFGNIYSTRQLLQLFDRAYGLFEPYDSVWREDGGNFIDPFRPRIEKAGFSSLGSLETDRTVHLEATRKMFEACDVFIFTLGLTEIWRSKVDGAAFPLAPGVAGQPNDTSLYQFHNLSVVEMADDLRDFFKKLRTVNPSVKIILTVSPVPLIATYEKRHVLTSTIYSKSALRVVAEIASTEHSLVAYFPSYEMITGHHAEYSYFDSDLRSVSPEGVDYVMSSFMRNFTQSTGYSHRIPVNSTPSSLSKAFVAELDELAEIVCDEEALVR